MSEDKTNNVNNNFIRSTINAQNFHSGSGNNYNNAGSASGYINGMEETNNQSDNQDDDRTDIFNGKESYVEDITSEEKICTYMDYDDLCQKEDEIDEYGINGEQGKQNLKENDSFFKKSNNGINASCHKQTDKNSFGNRRVCSQTSNSYFQGDYKDSTINANAGDVHINKPTSITHQHTNHTTVVQPAPNITKTFILNNSKAAAKSKLEGKTSFSKISQNKQQNMKVSQASSAQSHSSNGRRGHQFKNCSRNQLSTIRGAHCSRNQLPRGRGSFQTQSLKSGGSLANSSRTQSSRGRRNFRAQTSRGRGNFRSQTTRVRGNFRNRSSHYPSSRCRGYKKYAGVRRRKK